MGASNFNQLLNGAGGLGERWALHYAAAEAKLDAAGGKRGWRLRSQPELLGEVCWPVTSHCHPGRHSSGGSVTLTAPGDLPSVASSWQEARPEQVWKERTLASEDLAHIMPGVPKA